MQLFQEYIVGGVSHTPHLFNVNASDIKYLEQFETRFWVSALWERYNTWLARALKIRQRERDKSGYREFVTIKYHELLEKIQQFNSNYSERMVKKLALYQATNLAEEKFYHIQAKNTEHDMLVQAINYNEDSDTDRNIERKVVRANDYISDLIQDLEKKPLSSNGYDLTGLKEFPDVNTFTKSKYTTRGFQFPSKNTIREAVRRWIEYTGLDFLHNPREVQDESKKKEYSALKEREIQKLHINYFEKIYENFFHELNAYSTRGDLTNFLNTNQTIIEHIKQILTDHNIETLSRSGLIMTPTDNPEDSIEFIKKQFVKLVSDATDERLFHQFKNKYIKNRRIGRFIVNLLAQIDVRLARLNGTYIDPHDRILGFDAATSTDIFLGPKVQMKKITVKYPNEDGGVTEITTEVPNLISGKLLHPIHNNSKAQKDESAVGSIYHYEDLHLPVEEKSKKIKPFLQIDYDDVGTYKKYRLHPRDTIIGGGIAPNSKNSPKRHGFATNEEKYAEEIEKINNKLNFREMVISKGVDGNFSAIAARTATKKYSQIIVNFLIAKFSRKSTSVDRGQTISVTIRWNEWAKCMDINDFNKLHDQCLSLLIQNDVLSMKISNMRIIMNRLFDRMGHLDFGCGTKYKRNKDCKPPYDCEKIKGLIDLFYRDSSIAEEEGEVTGRKHDVQVRSDALSVTPDMELSPPFLQAYRELVQSYKQKFTGVGSDTATTNAELCASIFLQGVKNSGENIRDAIAREISRLSISSEKAECANVTKYNTYKRAYNIMYEILHRGANVNSEQLSVLEKFANPSSYEYNKEISDIVENIHDNTELLDAFIEDAFAYNPATKENLALLRQEYDVLKNCKCFNYTPYLQEQVKRLLRTDKLRDVGAELFFNTLALPKSWL